MTFGNQFPVIGCSTAPNAVVSTLNLIQGNGNPPSGWSISAISSDAADFAISGNNLVVASGGISHCNTTQAVQVIGTQPGGGTVTGQINLTIGP